MAKKIHDETSKTNEHILIEINTIISKDETSGKPTKETLNPPVAGWAHNIATVWRTTEEPKRNLQDIINKFEKNAEFSFASKSGEGNFGAFNSPGYLNLTGNVKNAKKIDFALAKT